MLKIEGKDLEAAVLALEGRALVQMSKDSDKLDEYDKHYDEWLSIREDGLQKDIDRRWQAMADVVESLIVDDLPWSYADDD